MHDTSQAVKVPTQTLIGNLMDVFCFNDFKKRLEKKSYTKKGNQNEKRIGYNAKCNRRDLNRDTNNILKSKPTKDNKKT